MRPTSGLYPLTLGSPCPLRWTVGSWKSRREAFRATVSTNIHGGRSLAISDFVERHIEGLQTRVWRSHIRLAAPILVLSDEWLVRGLLARTLRRAGYDVITAATSCDAIKAAQSYAGEIPLFITNDRLPDGKTGGEIAETIQRMRPKIQALYVVGYPEEATRTCRSTITGAFYLVKPFWPKQIVAAVESIVDDQASSSRSATL
jgi:CheY-like chemotaxis protein